MFGDSGEKNGGFVKLSAITSLSSANSSPLKLPQISPQLIEKGTSVLRIPMILPRDATSHHEPVNQKIAISQPSFHTKLVNLFKHSALETLSTLLAGSGFCIRTTT